MEKESVKVFDLQAAFKALDEIEAPKTKGLKANRVNLKERFAAKDATSALVEDYYNVYDHEALEEAKEDREDEIAKAKLARIEKIVDLDADTADDLLPSYVGKVIIQCPQCMTLFYKKPEDIEHSEENPDVVNVNEVCQHCGNTSGYTIIGKVDEVSDEEAFHFEGEENELDLDFPEATEETSPEGTGGGFEDELNLDLEGSEGSEDSEDISLDLEDIELDLEPTEESLKVNEAIEDSDSEDKDETEIKVTLGEIKDVAEEAGKAVVMAEVEEKEDVKEVTDKVVEKEVEAEKETLTEDLKEEADASEEARFAIKHEMTDDDKAAYEKIKAAECKDGECKEEVCPECGKEINECNKKLTEAPQTPDEIERILWNVADSFNESLEEEKVSDSEFKKMINSKVWKDFDEDLKEDLETVAANLPEYCDALRHAGDNVAAEVEAEKAAEEAPVEEPVEEGFGDKVRNLFYGDPEKQKQAESDEKVEEDLGDKIIGLGDTVRKVFYGDPEKQLKEPVKEDFEDKVIELGDKARKAFYGDVKDEEETDEVKEAVGDKVAGAFDKGVKLFYGDPNKNQKEDKVQEELGAKKPVVEESLKEEKINEASYSVRPDVLPWWIGSGSKAKEEGYKGTPEERTTHLEYVDENPADGKAILPDNIEKQLTEEKVEEHIQDRPAPIEDETEYQGVDNQVVPCETTLIVSHSEDEKPLDCKMEKEPLEKPLTGEKVEIKVLEDFNERFFDKAVNNFLKEVYSNINEYRTSSCELKEDKIFVEGTILFNSGRAKKTIFEFLPVRQELDAIILEGYNKDLTEEKAFTVKGILEGGDQFVTESFGYKYTINETLVEGLAK